MVYFVYTYFCGGVYNENPYGKMKAAIVSTIMIQDMMMVHWKKHGTLTLKEAADVAHRYPVRSSIPMRIRDYWKRR